MDGRLQEMKRGKKKGERIGQEVKILDVREENGMVGRHEGEKGEERWRRER